MTVERVRVVRSWEWARPERPARREVLAAVPEREEAKPPLLFVPGFGHGAWAFAEHWLGHAAGRGFPAYALSLRGHGGSEPAPEASTTTRAGALGGTLMVDCSSRPSASGCTMES